MRYRLTHLQDNNTYRLRQENGHGGVCGPEFLYATAQAAKHDAAKRGWALNPRCFASGHTAMAAYNAWAAAQH